MRKNTFNICFYVQKTRITVNGQAVQFGAKVGVKPDYWNVKAGKAIGKTNEAQIRFCIPIKIIHS